MANIKTPHPHQITLSSSSNITVLSALSGKQLAIYTLHQLLAASAIQQSSHTTIVFAPMQRTFTDKERAEAVVWLHAEVAARKRSRAALREWLRLSVVDSPSAAITTTAPEAAAAVPTLAACSKPGLPNPIMGLQVCERFTKLCEILKILDNFKDFTASDPADTVVNMQTTCEDLEIKLSWCSEYIISILKPDGKINPMLLAPFRLKQAGIRGPTWKRIMEQMKDLVQKAEWKTSFLSRAYDAMSAIDSLVPASF